MDRCDELGVQWSVCVCGDGDGGGVGSEAGPVWGAGETLFLSKGCGGETGDVGWVRIAEIDLLTSCMACLNAWTPRSMSDSERGYVGSVCGEVDDGVTFREQDTEGGAMEAMSRNAWEDECEGNRRVMSNVSDVRRKGDGEEGILE